MNKRKFVAKRSVSWRRFEKLLDRLDTISLRKFSPADTAEFSRLFRELCYDLSLIQSRDWGRGLVSYLNDLVSRGHNAFYSSPPGNLAHVVQFLLVGFPRLFRKNIGYFLTAAILFFGPLGITWGVVQHDTTLASRVIPPEQLKMYEKMYSDPDTSSSKEDDEDEEDDGSGTKDWRKDPNFMDQRSLMAGFYINHNTTIALLCFARGILLAVGTIYTLIENGIAIGATAGYLIGTGHSDRFLSFVVSHGSFELTAIAVAGGAGLMLGNAIVHPGQRSRLEALRVRGLEAIQIACGAAAMLFIAALIEGFWSPAVSIPNSVKYAGGAILWILVFVYLTTAGRWEEQS
ncbi:MAG: stage II sporulation protein M [Planctomycetes bacterium]|nr:stage II sporulation protein M [Planctomycetota bacterium]